MARKITTHLMFEGVAEAAMNLYVTLFRGSEITQIERYGPGERGAAGTVKRATFLLAGQEFPCIDSPVTRAFTFTPSISLFVECESMPVPGYRAIDRLPVAFDPAARVKPPSWMPTIHLRAARRSEPAPGPADRRAPRRGGTAPGSIGAVQKGGLLRFLDHNGVDATNNLAEREIRQAVIARKLSAGNRTESGAETHAVLASVLRTCRRQGRDILGVLGELLRRGPSHVIRLRPETPAIAALPSQGQ